MPVPMTIKNKKSKSKNLVSIKAAVAKQALNNILSLAAPLEREFQKYSIRGGCHRSPKGKFTPFVELVIGGHFIVLNPKDATKLGFEVFNAVKVVVEQATVQNKRKD